MRSTKNCNQRKFIFPPTKGQQVGTGLRENMTPMKERKKKIMFQAPQMIQVKGEDNKEEIFATTTLDE